MNIRPFLLIFFIVLYGGKNVFSQNENIKIKNEKGLFELSTPYLVNSISNSERKGFALMYGYPGFFSQYGQTTFYYTTSCENSFSLALGMGGEYILAGINLKVGDFNSSKIYLNVNFGPMGESNDEVDFLGSIGISYLIKNISNDLSCEISISTYFNNGYLGVELFTKDTPFLSGTMINIHFRKKINNNLFLIYGIGFSFIKYRYIIDNNISRDPPYNGFYVTSNYCTGNISGEEFHWDKKFIIPFGISLIYHF